MRSKFVRYGQQIRSGLRHFTQLRLSVLRKVFSLMSQKEKTALVMLAVVALVTLFGSVNNVYLKFTQSAPANGGEYREGLVGQPRLINPLLASTSVDQSLTHLVFSGLYKYDGSGKIVPDLAEGLPEISADQKQYTVRLRQNVFWHNDKPFTADDVLFTIHTAQNPNYKSPLRSQWLLTTVEKTDDYTVVFKNRDISGPFTHTLTAPILSKYLWQQVDPNNFLLTDANLKAIGTGPYAIKEIKKLPQGKVQSISFEANPKYHSGSPHISSLIINFYDDYPALIAGWQSKEVQGLGFIPFDTNFFLDPKNSNLQIFNLPIAQYQTLLFNLPNRTLGDRTVRSALQLATNKYEIIDQVFRGQAHPLNGPLVPGQLGFAEQPATEFNIDKANLLLDQAGWKIDSATGIRTKNKTPLELTISTSDNSLNASTAQLVADQWKKLNIIVKLNIVPVSELNDSVIRPRAFQVLLLSEKVSSDPDPFAYWHSSQVKSPGLNVGGYNNALADKLITQARTTTKTDVRENTYKQFQSVVNNDVPVIFINQSVFVYALEKKVKGVRLQSLVDPSFRFFDAPNWYISEKRVWQ